MSEARRPLERRSEWWDTGIGKGQPILDDTLAYLAQPEPAAECETCDGWDWHYFCGRADSVSCPFPRTCPSCGRIGERPTAAREAEPYRETVLVEALRLAKHKAEQIWGGQVNPKARARAIIQVADAALAGTSPAAAALLAQGDEWDLLCSLLKTFAEGLDGDRRRALLALPDRARAALAPVCGKCGGEGRVLVGGFAAGEGRPPKPGRWRLCPDCALAQGEKEG